MKKWDTLLLGFVVGALGLIIGFLLLGLAWSAKEESSLHFFIQEAFINAPMYKVKILSGSSILNVIIFFWAFQKEHNNIARGIIGTLILTLIAILIFY
ncbi:MAG: ABC-type phosphate transport system permease subunit [Flavobacteriales bacterium]|jgi:ABC-type phosphate transport system permease subunit